MYFGVITLASLFLASVPEAPSDVELWNRGVSHYEAGDVSNALDVLRPLMLSKTHGARAAEVVAALEFARGDREASARAAQLALRANPSDAKANRNFPRATDGLLAEREEKRIAAVLKAAEGKDPGSLLKVATDEARRLLVESGTYRTNAAPRAVALADQYAKRANRLADSWYPVREAIASSVTNEQDAATILTQLDQGREATRRAARQLEDLHEEAYASMSAVEHDFTRFLKMVALPPLAMDEDLLSQTNAYLKVERLNDRTWQRDALDFTRGFRAKFPAWARQYEQAAQSDTNKPPFTAEAQAKISSLATELEKLQLACVEVSDRQKEEEALRLINEIRELLPKDPNGQGGNSDQQQNQQQNQDQQQQPQEQPQQDQQNENEAQQEENPEQVEEEQDDASGEEEERQEDEEVEAILKKAQERNDEHEADKKMRMRKAPLPPNERDW